MQEATSTSSAELARLSELIDSIYQGATDPAHWDVVLPAITHWIDAPKGMLYTPMHTPGKGGFYFNHAIPEQFMQLWATKYIAEDLWSIRGVELGLDLEGNVILGEEIVPFEEFSRSKVHQTFFSKCGITHLLTSCVFGRDSPKHYPLTVCAFYRSLKEGRFTSYERDRLALLVPHLSRSLGVMTRLRDMELKVASSLSALDRLNVGVLLFNSHGLVAFANRAASRILEEEDGLQLRHRFGDSSLGEVFAENDKSHSALMCAIRSAISPDILQTAHFSRAVAAPRPSGRQDYTLNFSSLAAHNEFGSGSDAPCAIAFITDNAEPIKLDGELLQNTYGLTPAEVRLAGMMAECLTVEESAQRLGVSVNTVKTQLQSIYAKTNTNSRTKLMKLIMSLAQVAG